MAASHRWKAVEREVAAMLGGKRTNRDRGERVEDITHPLLSVEVKHGAYVPVFVVRTVEQAHLNSPNDKIPVSVMHRKGERVEESLVCMKLSSLIKLLELAARPTLLQPNPPTQQDGQDLGTT